MSPAALIVPRLDRRALALAVLLTAFACVLAMATASPALAGAWWRLSARPAPTLLPPGGKATIVVSATNVGDAGIAASEEPVTIKDTLPAGLEAVSIQGLPAFRAESSHLMDCDLKTLSCTTKPEDFPAFEPLEVKIEVNVKAGAVTGETNVASIEGGRQDGAGGPAAPVAGASLSTPLTVSGVPTPFGVEEGGYTLTPEAEGGAVDRQAGSHPFQLTTKLDLNQTRELVTGLASAPALPKELSFDLPPGLIGDPLAVPQCSNADFGASFVKQTNACKPETAIGVAVVSINEPLRFGVITRPVPLWNLEPAQGEPARFGFEVIGVPVVLDTSVRSSGDYGVTVSVNNAPQAAQILGSEVTIWGVPGDPRHDRSRGWLCLDGEVWAREGHPCQPQQEATPPAFLTLPTSCVGALGTTVTGSTWPIKSLADEPGQIFRLQGPSTRNSLPGMEGCTSVPFTPGLGLEPVFEDEAKSRTPAHAASSPAGLTVDVHLPQASTLDAGSLGEADLRTTTVTLPEGVRLNPASADGLQACSEAAIGFEGLPETDPLAPGASQPLRFSSAPAQCPDQSKLGVVRVRTPLLAHELTGSVFLAEPAPRGESGRNPFNSLVALYVVAEDPFSGIRVKLAGEAKLDPQTGRISSTFDAAPQVPFEDFVLEFFGGPRGSISTPALCGNYTTEASFTPWSGNGAVGALTPPGEFSITSGPGGAPCASPQPFAPAFAAGVTNLQAGGYAPFTLDIVRHDSDQALRTIDVRLPPGAAAMLSSVNLCGEPQASLGTCGPESEIGHASAGVGLGPDPFTVGGGRVYITGPYGGAPFGLSIVTPAVAGPFDLGNVVVRSSIRIDPSTAAVTISSALPAIVQGVGMPSSGVPLQLHSIHVEVDRPNFQFNPTNCNPTAITGTLSGAQGAVASVSSPFQVEGCAALPFHPTLTASTKGDASKANGASFTVKVSSSPGQANIAKTKLVLPIALPARLTTIQKACLAATFEANPATCPEGSNIGSATVHTPVLKSPLNGPAYLVSHGNAAFPDVEFVLQGEGITLILDGQTDIKKGITTSTFNSVPDAPVSSFETTLPEGPHSALTSNVPQSKRFSLCGQKLTMPTTITGQNGAVIQQNTAIPVSGCGGVKGSKATRAQLLAKALKKCRKQFKHSRRKRASCEGKARKRYGARKKAKKAKARRASARRAA